MKLRDYGIGVFIGALGGLLFATVVRRDDYPLRTILAAPWLDMTTEDSAGRATYKALPADYWWFR